MAKPSAFAMKLQRQAEAKATLKGEMARRFALQQGQDIACIALHVAFGFGPERIKRFVDAYAQVFNEYASKALEDAKDDDEIIHTKGNTDPMRFIKRGADKWLLRMGDGVIVDRIKRSYDDLAECIRERDRLEVELYV